MTQAEIERELVEQMAAHPRIQSYVADKYFVSTVWRQSSSIESDHWYYETIVWEWDSKTKETGKMITMGSGIHSHFEFCKLLLEGIPLEAEEA